MQIRNGCHVRDRCLWDNSDSESKRQAEDEHKVENPKTLTGTDFNVYMVY